MIRRVVLDALLGALFAVAGIGCGPEPGETGQSQDGGTGNDPQNSSSSSVSASETGADGTTGSDPCVEVHEGDLSYCPEGAECGIDSVGSLEFSNVRRITGHLRIVNTELQDLTGLSCLEEVQSIRIQGNTNLTSLHGLERLTNVEGFASPYSPSISIQDNPALQSLDGLDSLRELESLHVWFNDSLTSVGISSLERLGLFWLGGCQESGGEPAFGLGDNPSLVTLEGFDSLLSVDMVEISGQQSLLSLAPFIELANNGTVFGAPTITECNDNPDSPAGIECTAVFRYNESLGISEIEAFVAAADIQGAEVCGNMGGPEACDCMAQGG